MKLPKLIERVAFDIPVETVTSHGGTRIAWTEEFIARAQFLYLRGGETVIASRLSGRQPVVVTMRNEGRAKDVTPEWRMRDVRRGTVYNVRSIVPTDNRLYLELTCESGVST